MEERIARGDAAVELRQGTFRRHPSGYSAAVADRALVAWLAERRAGRSQIVDSLDACVGGSEGDEVGVDLAEWFESLQRGQLAGI